MTEGAGLGLYEERVPDRAASMEGRPYLPRPEAGGSTRAEIRRRERIPVRFDLGDRPAEAEAAAVGRFVEIVGVARFEQSALIGRSEAASVDSVIRDALRF